MNVRAIVTGGLIAVAGVSAHSATTTYQAVLNGATETPPTGSPATGTVTVIYSDLSHILNVSLSFSGLIGGPAAAAHIHCCTLPGTNVGVAVPFVGFPAVTSGTYNQSFDLSVTSTYTASFLSAGGGETALIAGFGSGLAYVNIHDGLFPGGEIRGFLQPVPEPETYVLMLAGLGALGLISRSRKEAIRLLPPG